MKYERLTKRLPNGGVKIENKTQWAVLYPENYTGYDIEAKMMLRLAELEDKIENGTLVELPCKVGDKLYLVYSPFGDIEEWEITDIQIGKANLFRLGHKETEDYAAVLFKELGEYAFLTKAEAEKRLEELIGER